MSLHAIGFLFLIAGFWIGAGALSLVVISLMSAVCYIERDRALYDDDPVSSFEQSASNGSPIS